MDSNTLRVEAFLKLGGISGWVWKGAKYKLCIYLTCMVYFTFFNNRLLTYRKIYMFNLTVCDQDRLGLFSLVTAYIFVINYQP